MEVMVFKRDSDGEISFKKTAQRVLAVLLIHSFIAALFIVFLTILAYESHRDYTFRAFLWGEGSNQKIASDDFIRPRAFSHFSLVW